MKALKRSIIESCDEIVTKGYSGIGFVVNGEYFMVKNYNINSIK
jgi:hypothetical protein